MTGLILSAVFCIQSDTQRFLYTPCSTLLCCSHQYLMLGISCRAKGVQDQPQTMVLSSWAMTSTDFSV